MIDAFIASRKSRWDQLEFLLDRVRKRPLSALSTDEIEEFGLLYRETTSDLAVARRDYPSDPVVPYLNSLLTRAYPYVYARRGGKARAVWRFFTTDFPATFRRCYRLVLISFLLFFVPAMIAYALSASSPEAAAVLAPQGIHERIQEVRRTGRWADISAPESSAAASTIMTNNVGVAIRAFAGGMTLGLLTIYVLVLNGLMLGSVAALAQQGGVGLTLWSFVSPHGWIELSVIFISGGAGLGIAKAVLLPGLLSRRDALVRAAQDAVKLLLGGAALLVIAGTIEGFFSPSLAPPWLKILFGFCTGIALYAYLIFAGRKARDSADQSGPDTSAE